MIILITIFIVLITTIGIIYFFSKPNKTPPKQTPQPEEKKDKPLPTEQPKEVLKKEQMEEQKEKSMPSRLVAAGKLLGFSSDIIDFSLLYDNNQKLIIAVAEVTCLQTNRRINSSYITSMNP